MVDPKVQLDLGSLPIVVRVKEVQADCLYLQSLSLYQFVTWRPDILWKL